MPIGAKQRNVDVNSGESRQSLAQKNVCSWILRDAKCTLPSFKLSAEEMGAHVLPPPLIHRNHRTLPWRHYCRGHVCLVRTLGNTGTMRAPPFGHSIQNVAQPTQRGRLHSEQLLCFFP
jgi:hypothetical protein